VLPTCQAYGMGVIPWAPLASGWLSDRWRKGSDASDSTRAERLPARYDLSLPGNQHKLDVADALAQLAEEAGLSLIELAEVVANHRP
jgi:aryl-alcohol dehydrogenase-like predicted oxidoreductase